MNLWKSFIMAFSGYSICPKSNLEKNKENCSALLVFLPVVGLIIGICINRWGVAYPYLCTYSLFPAVICAIVPSILSGGAHLDGFFRTVDAICSHKSREEKLSILKEDAHGGYSAITVCVLLFMVSLAVWSEMPIEGCFIVSFQYVLSRALYGISLLLVEHAGTGKADAYVPENKTNKMIQMVILAAYIMVCVYFMVSIHRSVGIACFMGALLAFVYYIWIAKKHFGGVTEEVANYFLIICEVIVPIAALFVYKKWF